MKGGSGNVISTNRIFIYARASIFRVALTALLASQCSGGHTLAAEGEATLRSEDQGRRSWVVDIEKLTLENSQYRAAKWTGNSLQMTVMSIPPGEEIGLEKHEIGDQFIRVEQGRARVVMGPSEDELPFDRQVSDDWAIFIPAGAWHNIINVGAEELKVYVIYAPPEHPAGTLHETPEEAEAEHGD